MSVSELLQRQRTLVQQINQHVATSAREDEQAQQELEAQLRSLEEETERARQQNQLYRAELNGQRQRVARTFPGYKGLNSGLLPQPNPTEYDPTALQQYAGAIEAASNELPKTESGCLQIVLITLMITCVFFGLVTPVIEFTSQSVTSDVTSSVYLAIWIGLSIGTIALLYVILKISTRRRKGRSQRREDNFLQAYANADQWIKQHESASQQHFQQAHDQLVNTAKSRSAQVSEQRKVAFRGTIRPAVAAFTTEAEQVSPAWGNARWQQWQVADHAPPGATRIGTVVREADLDQVQMPFLLHLPGPHAVIIKAGGKATATAVAGVQALLVRLLASIPPGMVRFTFIDPVGLGHNVAGLMPLVDDDESLIVGQRAWTDQQQIDQRLAALTAHMEDVIQKYLRDQYATIEEYNQQAAVAEPYQVVVVFDFPTNFTESTARRLVSIAQNGPRCGVYTIVVVDTEKPLPYGVSLTDLERKNAVLVALADRRFSVEDADYRDAVITLDGPPPAALTKQIVSVVGKAAKANSRVEVPFEQVAPARAAWWQGSTTADLRVALGPSGARKLQYLEFGKGTTHHALVVGRTGSGKSTLLHTLIINLALTYSPAEVQLYLIDFKEGVEFKTYATQALPHARVVAIETEREFGLSVLQGLDAEITRRGELFRASGAQGLSDYREKSRQPLPRLLLLVDEFQMFFAEDDGIAAQAGQLLDRLVRQGRSFGLHVLLGSQTLAGSYQLARSTIDQMGVRIALQCSDADSRLILADDNGAARLLTRPGEAIYNNANGLLEGNNPFQVAFLREEQRNDYLTQIQGLQRQSTAPPLPPQIVFEGDALAQLARNPALNGLLTGPRPTVAARSQRAWLGDPVTIRDAISTTFRRQSASNLLIVGQHEAAALGMTTSVLLSLAAQLPVAGPAPVAFLDFGAVDGPHADFFDQFAQQLPGVLRFGRRRQAEEVIGALATEAKRRLEADEVSAPPRYLFIHALHRARDLRQEEGLSSYTPYGEEPPPPSMAQQFTTLLREGPEVGIHTILWCDTVTNLNRTFDNRTLREFALRVACQMSEQDSSTLIDSPAASRLGQFRALLYNEDEGRLEKFRPYTLPASDWLAATTAQLRG